MFALNIYNWLHIHVFTLILSPLKHVRLDLTAQSVFESMYKESMEQPNFSVLSVLFLEVSRRMGRLLILGSPLRSLCNYIFAKNIQSASTATQSSQPNEDSNDISRPNSPILLSKKERTCPVRSWDVERNSPRHITSSITFPQLMKELVLSAEPSILVQFLILRPSKIRMDVDNPLRQNEPLEIMFVLLILVYPAL